MSRLEVPKVGSWWENPKQPDALVEVSKVILEKDVQLVIFRWGPNPADLSVKLLNTFFDTFTERGT
jgi:hypothetical protein